MPEIRHRVGVVAPLADVFTALTTTSGLAGWWTTDTTGDPVPGGKLAFRFGDVGGFDIEVLEVDRTDDPASAVVRWRVIDGPEEWIGTEIGFRLEQRGEYAIVLFSHTDWTVTNEFLHHCSTKWATFLMSLKAHVETGAGQAHPHDVQVSDWH